MRVFYGAALLLGLALPAQAGPIQPKEIAADAQWLVHIDVDAGMQSATAKQHLLPCLEKEQCAEHLEKLAKSIGFNPVKQLHSVTLYGRTLKPGEGVAIIKAEFNKEHLIEQGKKHAKLESTQHGDYTIYTAEHEVHGKNHSISGCFYAEQGLVVGRTLDDVKSALDVLSKGEGLGEDSPLLVKSGEGTITQAAAIGLDKAKWPKHVPPALRSNAFKLASGEVNGQSFGSLTVTAANAEIAEQMKQVVEGGKALAALRAGNQEGVQEMLARFKVDSAESVVTISWEFKTDEMIALVKKVVEQERNRRRENRERSRDDDKKENKKERPRQEKKTNE